MPRRKYPPAPKMVRVYLTENEFKAFIAAQADSDRPSPKPSHMGGETYWYTSEGKPFASKRLVPPPPYPTKETWYFVREDLLPNLPQ